MVVLRGDMLHDLTHELQESEATNQRLSDAITGYLPYLPKSTASEGGAVRHSGQVKASDELKQALEGEVE